MIDKHLSDVVKSSYTKSIYELQKGIGVVSQRRSGEEPQDALDTLLQPIRVDPVKINTNGSSQRFKGEKSYVTVDPGTGILIQTNPRRGG